MAKHPEITVVVPALDAERTLRRAVESVWNCGYPAVRVLIVDDGSRDASLQEAQRLCEESAGRCRLLRHADHGRHGVSASRNLGVEAADSEWIAFLDSDDEYLAGRFDGFVRALASAPDFDGIHELAVVRTEGRSSSEDTSWWSAEPDSLFGLREGPASGRLLTRLLEGVCWATSAIVLRRSAFLAVGGFDTSKSIAEDCHLWLRLAAAHELKPGRLDAPVSVYWRHGSNTYQYAPEHRAAMLAAMLDAWHWARGHGCRADRLEQFRNMVPRYALRSMIALREAGRPRLLAGLLSEILRKRARLLASPAILRQLAAGLLQAMGRAAPATATAGGAPR
jgi:glycosyltransferase involved in cell wall biosynthesis